MKKIAILIDAGFFKKKYNYLKHAPPKVSDIKNFVTKCVKSTSEELFRIYYYDCAPCERDIKLPINKGTTINFLKTPIASDALVLQDGLAKSNYFALRKGILSFDKWQLSERTINELKTTPRSLRDGDFIPLFRQKQVDMKIGLDVAWLASKKIVDKIVLVTGDSDFIPVLKFARREGIQTVLITLGHTIKGELKEHCDEFRKITL